MNEPDGNTAAERLHNDGMTTDEEREFEQTCLEIVRDEFYNDDQRAIEVFQELDVAAKAIIIRYAFNLSFPDHKEAAIRSMAKYPWVQDKALELMQDRREAKEVEDDY